MIGLESQRQILYVKWHVHVYDIRNDIHNDGHNDIQIMI